MSKPIYKRVMLKVSGEGLMGDKTGGIDESAIFNVAKSIAEIHDLGVEICIVVGGGNIYRGMKGAAQGMDRVVADHMGMLATVMNALALQNAVEKAGVKARVMSGFAIPTVCEEYIHRKANRHFEKNRIIIFAAGTGNPYFTTDTGAVLRATEMKCDVILKSTQVDGVYDSDPRENKDANRYDVVSYSEVLEKDLKVMDMTAIALAQDQKLPIVVFSQSEKDSLKNIICGKGNYTKIIHKDEIGE